MNTTGFIIAIDGPDGSGKTTQIAKLKSGLEKQGYIVHSTRANGGTPIGEELRKASLSNAARPAEVDLYISLALHTALAEDIQKRKQRGEIILIDRSPLAIIAYQNFGSQLKDQQLGYEACKKMLELWQIDLLLVFDIAKDELSKRSALRKKIHAHETTNYFENQNDAFKQRIFEGYNVACNYAQSIDNISTRIETVNAGVDETSLSQTILERVLSLIA